MSVLWDEQTRFGTSREELAMLSIEELVDMVVELRTNLLVTEVMCDRLDEDNFKRLQQIEELTKHLDRFEK